MADSYWPSPRQAANAPFPKIPIKSITHQEVAMGMLHPSSCHCGHQEDKSTAMGANAIKGVFTITAKLSPHCCGSITSTWGGNTDGFFVPPKCTPFPTRWPICQGFVAEKVKLPHFPATLFHSHLCHYTKGCPGTEEVSS